MLHTLIAAIQIMERARNRTQTTERKKQKKKIKKVTEKLRQVS